MAHKINELLGIMARLRDPRKGCPWDQKQTWQEIKDKEARAGE